jgi:hypothetical protein
MAKNIASSLPLFEEDPYGLDEDLYGLVDEEEEDTPEVDFSRDRRIDWGDLPDEYDN